MRALGFDLKKAEVLKIMRDVDKHGTQRMGFDDFVRISVSWLAPLIPFLPSMSVEPWHLHSDRKNIGARPAR